MSDRPEWFAPKRYGLGTGLPIAWQGWVLVGLLFASVGLALLLFGRDDWRVLTIILPAVAAFIIIAALTTKGGWKWRWGKDDQ